MERGQHWSDNVTSGKKQFGIFSGNLIFGHAFRQCSLKLGNLPAMFQTGAQHASKQVPENFKPMEFVSQIGPSLVRS